MDMMIREKTALFLECEMLIAVLLTEKDQLYRAAEVSRLLYDPQEAPLEHENLALRLENWMHPRMATNVNGDGFSASYSGRVWTALPSSKQREMLSSRLANPGEEILDQLDGYIRMEKARANIANKLGINREHPGSDLAQVANGLLACMARLEGVVVRAPMSEPEAREEQEVEASEPALGEVIPLRRRRWFGILLKGSAVAGLFAVVAVAFLAARFPSKTFDVLQKEGLAQANRYLEGVTDKSALSPQEQFQVAWVEARNGRLEEAEKMIGRLLYSETIPSKVKADCFYLQGQILSIRGNYRDALSRYAAAGEIYGSEGLAANSYTNILQMASAYLSLDELTKAEKALARAKVLFGESEPKSVDLGSYYAISARLSEKRGDYSAAIDFQLKASEIYSIVKNVDKLAGSYSSLGYYYLRMGNISKAYHYTLNAQEMIHEFSDDRKYYFNQINFVGLMRCQGIEANDFVRDLEEWANSHDDSELLKFLSEVQSICDTGGNDHEVTE